MSGTTSLTSRRRNPSTPNPAEENVNTQLAVSNQNRRTGDRTYFSFVKVFAAVGTTALALWAAHVYQYDKPIDPLDFKSRTERVLATTPLIDGHNDLPYLLRIELKNKIYDKSIVDFRDSRCSQSIISLNFAIESLTSYSS
jgi:hypothetical protein